MPDLVYVQVTADLPIRSTVQPYANRIELRFGKAYPVALVIDRAALDQLGALIEAGRAELDAALANGAKRRPRGQQAPATDNDGAAGQGSG